MSGKVVAIKALAGCGASGQSLAAGHTYLVPDEVSEKDAGILIRMGKAAACERPPIKPARKVKDE